MRTRYVLPALIAVTLLAYYPAWTGSLLWDDEGHLTRTDLRSMAGLGRIWFSPGATQQYYPVLHSAFWVFHHLWGDQTVGYHLVNIALHSFSAWLLWLVLLRLSVPGALLAAAVFALHPVHVESVAWITELKNVLSGAFYLAAAFVYLRYDSTRDRRSYVLALLLFVLAILSKTVTVTLPVALLALFWWKRGYLRIREDMVPLVPFAAAGLAAGLTTIWFERAMIGAQGSEFGLTFVERCLLASRAVGFYAGKLLWPADLAFIYPRWTIDVADAGQWLFPVALLVVTACAWMIRGRSRAPLAALLFFVATLFPALGFFNVYPFRFSYVADHFQYLASIGPIVFVAAGLTIAARRWPVGRLATGAACVLSLGLGALTFLQAEQYASAESLYRATIQKNPSAWLARNNLAALLLAGDPSESWIAEATTHLETAIRLQPEYPEAHYNLGTAFELVGRMDDAVAKYQTVLRIDPDEPRAHKRLGVISQDRASRLLEQGLGFENAGRLDQAESAYRQAAALDPARAIIRRSLGRTLHRLGRKEQAIAEYRASLELDPSSVETHNDLGVLFAESGRLAEAVQQFEAALRLDPSDPAARDNLSRARALVSPRR